MAESRVGDTNSDHLAPTEGVEHHKANIGVSDLRDYLIRTNPPRRIDGSLLSRRVRLLRDLPPECRFADIPFCDQGGRTARRRGL